MRSELAVVEGRAALKPGEVAPLLAEFDNDRHEARTDQITESGEFGSTFASATSDWDTVSYAALSPAAGNAAEQLQLDLPSYSERARIRLALADKIALDLADAPERWLQRIPQALRQARRSGQWGLRLETFRPIVYWDVKAGLSRLCPDDAREESMRLRRRVQAPLEALQASGHRLTYAVFTLPNAAPGALRSAMVAIFKRYRKVVVTVKDFPEIVGSLAVLEAPLGRGRDWNVHLNVIFASKGFVDWGKLRRAWHWNVEFRTLPKTPGAVGSALAELIKYAVAATVSKSIEKQEAGGAAPSMLEWRPGELGEWLRAFHGFRRTRAYGALYGLKAPEPEPVGPIAWLGSVGFTGARYALRCPLLDLIPEDKSNPRARFQALAQLYRQLAPGGIATIGPLLDRFERAIVYRR
jgi:hypothetical protein